MTSYLTPKLLKALDALHEVGWVGLNDDQVKEALQEKHGTLGTYLVLFALKDFREKIELANQREAERKHNKTLLRNREYEKAKWGLMKQYKANRWDDVLGILRQQYRHTDSEGKQDLIVKWYNDYFMPFRTIEKITKTTFYHIIKVLGMDDGSWEEEDDNYDD
ncbi:hypothetical protein [Limosilactobacillus fermentum]|uniref:hypothetical protein n=1 Tax=Limosilactobacillus fermentum TaxID=1613 RepID=UPI003D772E36